MIQLGNNARRDPILSLASMFASGILREVAPIGPTERLRVLREKLDRLYPGMGDQAMNKFEELHKKGRSSDQALFDGVRLALANRLAEYSVEAVSAGVGLGKMANATQSMCLLVGTAATVGGWLNGAFKDPTSSTTINTAAGAGADIMGCNAGALEAQARIAEANARAAEAGASAANRAPAASSNKTLLYVGIGGGVLLVGVLGVMVMKK